MLKGFAIFLMVMGHALSWSYSADVVRTADNAFVRNLIYAFHMPLFFFMSGYVIDLWGKGFDSGRCRKLLWKRVQSLALPCIVWYGISGFTEVPWFLRALFLIICLFLALKSLLRLVRIAWLADLLLLFGGYVLLLAMTHFIRGTALDAVFDMTTFQIHYPYFVVGYLYRKYEASDARFVHFASSNLAYTLCLMVFTLTFYVYNWTEQPHSLHAALRYLLAFSGIFVAYNFAKGIGDESGWIYRQCLLMGRHSMEIYLVSAWFILSLPGLFGMVASNGGIMAQALFGVALSVPCVVCCLAFSKIVGRSKVLNLLLFGKR